MVGVFDGGMGVWVIILLFWGAVIRSEMVSLAPVRQYK